MSRRSILAAVVFTSGLLFGINNALTAPMTGGQAEKSHIHIYNAWAKSTPTKVFPNGVAYAFIQNKSDSDDSILSVTSNIARVTEVHEMLEEDGIMSMRHRPQLAVPAGQTVRMGPGGLHFMLLDITKTMDEGHSVPLTITFEKAGPVTVEMPIYSFRTRDWPGKED